MADEVAHMADAPAIRGSCLCGGVRFTITQPFVFFHYCHCSRCRKASGTAHAANILVKQRQLRWLQGEELVRRWELPAATRFCTAFCTVCGSAMPWMTRDGKGYVVPAGALDDDPSATPTKSIFWASRAPWYVELDDVPRYDDVPR